MPESNSVTSAKITKEGTEITGYGVTGFITKTCSKGWLKRCSEAKSTKCSCKCDGLLHGTKRHERAQRLSGQSNIFDILSQQKADLQTRIALLTRTLKDISPSSPSYARIWDERVDLKWKLSELNNSK